MLKKNSMNICKVIVVTFVSSTVGATVSTAQAPIEEELVARWIDTYNTGDAQKIGALYALDASSSFG